MAKHREITLGDQIAFQGETAVFDVIGFDGDSFAVVETVSVPGFVRYVRLEDMHTFNGDAWEVA